MYSKVVEEFLERQGINLETVRSTIDTNIYKMSDVNPIADNHGFTKNRGMKLISIADIIGYDNTWRGVPSDIFFSMSSYFDSDGTTYQSRAIEMLDYSSDEIVEALSKSFKVEPIKATETGTGKYVITSNGLHRYTLLRALFLSELSGVEDNADEASRIREKYKIPVEVTELDVPKTYSKFLLMFGFTPEIKSISSEYDANCNRTGNAIVTKADGEKTIMNDDELIAYTKDIIKPFANNLKPTINFWSKRIESFKTFLEENFNDVFFANNRNVGGQDHD